jgi:hypothetical protein
MDDGGDMTCAHSVNGGNGELQGIPSNEVARFGNMNINYSRPNELMQDVAIPIPRAVRIVRTVRAGLPVTAMASDTGATKSKESSFQIADFLSIIRSSRCWFWG